MNKATIKNNPDVLPESIAEEPSARIVVVLIKLLTDPKLVDEAVMLHREHQSAFLAFLLTSVSLKDLTNPTTLQQAFVERHLATTRDWSEVRNLLIDGIVDAATARAGRDAEFKERLDRDPLKIVQDFGSCMRVVKVGERTHLFATPNGLQLLRQK